MDYGKHEEMKEGEVLLGNTERCVVHSYIGKAWKTARIGKVAYNSLGEVQQGRVPVFVSKEEFADNQRGIGE